MLVQKIWALSFRRNGRTKYAYEMLHLIHNLNHVWPEEIRNIVLKNWLVNPSGLPNRNIEMDLAQEHLNFKIKISYKARGSNASWEWLETISPCVVVLGDLQKTLNDTLGGDQGTKHAPPDLKDDIESLMSSLDEHKVYQIQKGRMVKEEEVVKDVVGVGLQNLTAGEKNPLNEYNAAFKRLQRRRKMKPVSLAALEGHSEQAATAHIPTQPPPASPVTSPIPLIPAAEGDEEEFEEGPASNETSEIDKILEDIENGVADETLPRLTEDDVVLDMDEIMVEDEEFVDTDESDSDEGEDDVGWMDDEERE
ncbi:uncharacterized protein LACBIDRAFT_309524 [Laccaria bicolor S238N-H82]|uniref:Predicted protein n=1 Tax=Laccaria bicolor (strain S238N-H82 / ATCC MYA-4686) TaxID=486041 RepID=B0DSI7_LACBS|nr:uncharacterized protein LACBIDRAFT_309524 [Laccaria bicolor S238N-H82]EDR02479.1 predicted protein [Laccaria bicolor S238N-H82]|eukprot:XP_001886842.1 predicted protein [Laccaria bicolor S238N-H82]